MDALRWMTQLAEGLVYLHGQDRRIVHRDLKLENVLLTGAAWSNPPPPPPHPSPSWLRPREPSAPQPLHLALTRAPLHAVPVARREPPSDFDSPHDDACRALAPVQRTTTGCSTPSSPISGEPRARRLLLPTVLQGGAMWRLKARIWLFSEPHPNVDMSLISMQCIKLLFMERENFSASCVKVTCKLIRSN